MLNKRCSQLMYKIISLNDYESISFLSECFKVCNRTIRYDLDKIDDFLLNKNLPQLIRKPNEGISFNCNLVQKNKILDLLSGIDSYEYVLSHNERVTIILSELLTNKKYITIDKLANILFVSRSTIIKDKDKVKEWLNDRNLDLVSYKQNGIMIIGEETDVRKSALELLTININVYAALNLIKNSKVWKTDFALDKYQKEFFNEIDMSYIENCISIAEEQLECKYSDEAYSALVVHIAIAIKRIQQYKDIVMLKDEITSLQNTKEFTVASSIAKMLENKFKIIIPMDEIGYITIHLLGSNFLVAKSYDENWMVIEILISDFIKKVSTALKINLTNDKQLYDNLLQHMRPTIYRLKHGLILKNPLLKEIKQSYLMHFKIIKENLPNFESFSNNKLSDEEIGYITLHFETSMEKNKNSNKKLATVLLVCATGIGTAKFVSSKLLSIFDINIVDTISYHQLKEVLINKKVDLIITTVPIKTTDSIVQCIEVNPFLTEKNISEISSALRKYNLEVHKIDISLEKILGIVGENCTIIDKQRLTDQLSNYLKVPNNCKKGVFQPMLKDVLIKDAIKLNINVSDWEEAIVKGGNLLVKTNCAEERYIDAMIDTVKNIGPYIVIAPGIAMPHARPDSGVKKIGMSLITLSEPINFGNKENDPVKIVVSLCAIDHSSHIKALSELANFLGNPKFIETVLNAKDEEEIISYITMAEEIDK